MMSVEYQIGYKVFLFKRSSGTEGVTSGCHHERAAVFVAFVLLFLDKCTASPR